MIHKFTTLILLALFSLAGSAAVAAPVAQSDRLKLGRPSSSGNKVIEFDLGNGTSNPQVRANKSTGKLEYTLDGSTWRQFNLGTAIDSNTAPAGTVLTADGSSGSSFQALGTAQTAGGITFGTGTGITNDQANLAWDNTNKRAGFGTNAPGQTVSIGGSSNTGLGVTGRSSNPTAPASGVLQLFSRTDNRFYQQDSTGAVQPLSLEHQNWLYNGSMLFWQRGTSFASGYTADRWRMYRFTSGVNSNVSQITLSATDVPGMQYALRRARDSGTSDVYLIGVVQSLPTSDAVLLRGKTVTLSFYMRCGANFSAASGAVTAVVSSGTGTDQAGPGIAWTGGTTVASGNATCNSSYTRYQYTGTVGSSVTGIYVDFAYTPVGTAGANDWFEITGVQLTEGSSAPSFALRGRTNENELKLLETFYEKSYGWTHVRTSATSDGSMLLQTQKANSVTGTIVFKTRKRTNPIMTFYSTSGASNAVKNQTSGADIAAPSLLTVGVNQVVAAGTPTITQGDLVLAHWDADSEMY